MARQYSPDEIGALLHDAQRDATRPRGATVADVRAGLLRAVLFGAGAFLLVGGLLYWFAAPLDVLLQSAALAGVLTLGTALLLLAMPRDHMAYLRRVQQAQRLVNEAVFRKEEAYRRIVALEAEYTAKIAELQRALSEAHTDLRNVRMELRRTQENMQQQAGLRRTFVPKSNTEPQVVRDAQSILRHWFEASAWYSRPKAVQAGWSEDRHANAVRLLDDAGLVGKVGKLREVNAPTLDDALRRLADWRESAETAPVMPPPVAYVESE